MGAALANWFESTTRGYGGCRSLVCASWRPQHCASFVAVCGSGGETQEEGEELGEGGMGEYGAQDGPADSEYAEPDSYSYGVVASGMSWGTVEEEDEDQRRCLLLCPSSVERALAMGKMCIHNTYSTLHLRFTLFHMRFSSKHVADDALPTF